VTDSGLNVKVILPIYYADLGQLTSGDTVDFVAKNPVGNVLYQHTAVTIPDKATILQPVEGASINVNEDVTIQWNEGTNAEGYVVGYLDTGNSDAETTDDDAGTYTEYVGASTTEETVPSTYTVAGDATFSVDAVSGDTDIFTSEEDTTESFFIVGTSDWIEAKIVADVTAAPLAAENQPAEDRASQGLKIVKEYKKKIEGLRFKMRECDPNQIQSSGAVTVRFKLRGSYRLAIAFVALYDMNGNQYASWSKKRQKRKSKKYSHTFSSVQPGTTVVFGTHAASYRGGTYSY